MASGNRLLSSLTKLSKINFTNTTNAKVGTKRLRGFRGTLVDRIPNLCSRLAVSTTVRSILK